MAELIKVDLARIDANPFRDIESYPFDEAKIERLTESINSTGFWPNVIVRKTGTRYQCAYGHHRLNAAKRAGVTKAHVVLKELSDDEMLRMMVDENATEYGHDFFTILNSVSAVVRAYGMGSVDIDPPPPGARDQREAPAGSAEAPRMYTAGTIARYMGWTRESGKGGAEAPALRVLIALNALELIEREVLTLEEFRGITQTAAALKVKVVNARMRAERADMDATIKVRTEALKKAEKEGDTNKAESLKASVEDLTEKAEKQAARAGRAAAKKIAEDLRPPSPKEVAEKAAPKSTDTETKAVKTATQTLYDLIAKWESLCLETDPKWEKSQGASERSKEAAKTALLALSERAKNRAREF